MFKTVSQLFLVALVLGLMIGAAYAGRDGGGYYNAQRVANLRANIEKYDWAAQERDKAVVAAQPWVEKSDEELWRLIPSQKLPRTIDLTVTRRNGRDRGAGCPVCGEKIFESPHHGNWIVDFAVPWKVKCSSCGTIFPTNNFGKFYESALDEHGCFDRDRGDNSLLFNTEHPDPDDPLHKWGVDDGWGCIDEDGNEFRFIAVYTFRLWRHIRRTILSPLVHAYLYTGDPIYAHKAGVILDRIADVYPDMDWAPYAALGWYHSDGGSGMGKVEGRIWECGTIGVLARYYDIVADGLNDCPELLKFLAQKAQQYDLPGDKGTVEDLHRNIEDGLLRCGAQAIMDRRIRGNHGHHEGAMAAVAMAFGRDPEMSQWLDWIFAADGGGLTGVIIGGISRDCVGSEAGPGYSLGWGSSIGRLADRLADFAPYDKHDIYRDFPTFRKTFTAPSDLIILGLSTPSIGDHGLHTGSLQKTEVHPNSIARGYRYLRDPKLALLAYRANGNSAEGLQRSIYDVDPYAIQNAIAAIGEAAGRTGDEGGSFNRTGYGLMSLEHGYEREGAALWMYYGITATPHGHKDRLNIGIYGFGLKLAPDLGYPEYASNRWPKRWEWTSNTISHNTVLVDSYPQEANADGHPVFFKRLPGVSANEVRSANVYKQCDTYARTIALISVGEGDAYALDIFRVRGGQDHLLSFHATPGEPTLTSLNTVKQPTGPYAGPDIEFAQRPAPSRSGFWWLYDVERDSAPPAYGAVDWHVPDGYWDSRAADNIHLRYHHFTPADEVALCHGDPPQRAAGAPRTLRYVLARRRAAQPGLTSTFVSLYEPYKEQPLITSVQRLNLGQDADGFDVVALRIELADGATDYLLSCRGDESAESDFDGRLGFLRVRDGAVERAVLIGGTTLSFRDFHLSVAEPALTGTIVQMDKDMEDGGRIWVDAELPTDGSLIGESIIIANDDVKNACYTIHAAQRDGEGTMLSLGDVCFIRDYVDRDDYSKGFVYNFEEGAAFTILTHAYVVRRAPNVYDIQSSLGEASLEK